MTPTATGAVAIVRATPAHAAALATLARRTFVETFAADNDPADMEAYLAGAFGEPLQRAELLDPHTTVLLAERDGEPVGYAMLRDEAAGEAEGQGDGAVNQVEIARLYAIREAIGSGVGAALMRAALAHAAARGAAALWLGVWERNARAIAFYERWGFRVAGAQHFQLGADRQRDLVMRRAVEPAR